MFTIRIVIALITVDLPINHYCSSSSSSSRSRFIERITQTPLMRYVSLCTANRRVINADMRLSMLSVGSRRNSGNVYPDDRNRDCVCLVHIPSVTVWLPIDICCSANKFTTLYVFAPFGLQISKIILDLFLDQML